MYLALKALKSDATVNNFEEVTSVQVFRGADAAIYLRLIQPERSGLRYIPAIGATFSISLNNSDGTSITKTPTQPFSDDKSVLKLDLSDSETQFLISQNLNVKVTEGSTQSFAVLALGLQMVSLSNDC